MKEKMLKILLVVLLVFSTVPRQIRADETEGSDVPEITQNETVHEEGEKETEDPVSEGEDKQDDLTLPAEEKNTEDPTEEDNKEPEVKIESVDDLLVEGLKEEDLEEEEDEEEELYDRTILMYAVGSDLESLSGLCSFNLRQILNSEFSKDDKVKFIVMTGGADDEDGWHLESDYLYDPSGEVLETISTDYNCIWEAKGLDAEENPGKLVLLDGDGVLGDGDQAVPAVPSGDEDEWDEDSYEFMSDPKVLKAFINYGYNNFPSEEYDIIFWDHGSGVYSGFGKDEHSGVLMLAGEMVHAIHDSDLYMSGERFGFIDFDACLMSSVELALMFAPYTHYYIASPEVIPGNGEYYTGWLNMLGENPDSVNNYELGKKIVDDYYEYYQNSGESDMDGTLALIDTDLLFSEDTGFVDALMELNEIMMDQLFNVQVYDELTAVSRSITYGGNEYYVDFGNLVSQLCVAVKEFEEEVPSGGRDLEVNDYYDVAERIMNILNNDEIIYNRCTSGIHTNDEIIYREFGDGQIKFATDDFPLTSSGLYMYIEPVERNSFRESEYYDRNISYTMEYLDPVAQKVIGAYLDAIRAYTLLIQTGKTITQMVEEGFDKDKIDFEAVLDYWRIPIVEDEFYSFSDWDFYVEAMCRNVHKYLDEPFDSNYQISEDDPLFKAWMDKMIDKMVEEAIVKENIELFEVDLPDGIGYRVRMNDVKKRVVDKVAYELIAEFPILEKYVEDNELDWIFSGESRKDIEVAIGMISGSELFDMDLEEWDGSAEEYIEWLNGDTSTWDLDAIEEKWYGLQDADGNLHAVIVEEDRDLLLVPMRRQVESVDEDGEVELVDEMVGLFFDGEELVSFMIKEDGTYRPVAAKDLKTELKLESCVPASTFVGRVYLPISTGYVINPDNIDQIKLVYTDIDNIPDIADTTGDDEKLTKSIVVYNIYGEKIDVTDMADHPSGYLKDIAEANVLDDEYTGEELSPRIVFDGQILKEGVDYKIIKATDEDVYKAPGEYRFFIQGMGTYVGGVMLEYKIRPSYVIKEGANGVYQKGSGNTLNFRFSRLDDDESTFDHFKKVVVDGKEVDPSKYTTRKGSIIISLPSTYLETLSNGDHTIMAVFDDGQSKLIRFTVKAKDTVNPDHKEDKKPYVLPLTGIE